jgi:hypothetical protein
MSGCTVHRRKQISTTWRILWDVGTAQCHVDEQRHTFLRLPKINPQIGIKYVKDQVGVSLIVASLFCVGVSTLVCPAKPRHEDLAKRLGMA